MHSDNIYAGKPKVGHMASNHRWVEFDSPYPLHNLYPNSKHNTRLVIYKTDTATAHLAQLVEAMALEAIKCQFESDGGHQQKIILCLSLN